MVQIVSQLKQIFSIAIPEFSSDLNDLREKIFLILRKILVISFIYIVTTVVFLMVAYLLLKQPHNLFPRSTESMEATLFKSNTFIIETSTQISASVF